MRCHAGGTNCGHHHQNVTCNREEDGQPHAYSALGLAVPADEGIAEIVPVNAAAGGVDRGVQPIATTPAGTNPEHNPGASTVAAR